MNKKTPKQKIQEKYLFQLETLKKELKAKILDIDEIEEEIKILELLVNKIIYE